MSLAKADDQTYIYLPSKKLDQDPNYQLIGRVDAKYENYHRLNFDEPTWLSLCDGNRGLCLSFAYSSSGLTFKKYNPDSNWDSYLSTTTRCDKGVVASNKTSPNAILTNIVKVTKIFIIKRLLFNCHLIFVSEQL